jgi:hypothetical protein
MCFDGNIYFVVDIRAYLSICDTTWHHGVQRLCFCERWPREPQTRAADASPRVPLRAARSGPRRGLVLAAASCVAKNLTLSTSQSRAPKSAESCNDPCTKHEVHQLMLPVSCLQAPAQPTTDRPYDVPRYLVSEREKKRLLLHNPLIVGFHDATRLTTLRNRDAYLSLGRRARPRDGRCREVDDAGSTMPAPASPPVCESLATAQCTLLGLYAV